jgi:hypothetical protein
MESLLKLNYINTIIDIDNQESNKILTYLKHELTDIDLEFKNRQVIGNCIIRLSTEEVVVYCNLLEAIEEWNRNETIPYYIQKIFCCANSPSNLANCFIINSDLNKNYNLRNLLELKIPDKGNFNDFGE